MNELVRPVKMVRGREGKMGGGGEEGGGKGGREGLLQSISGVLLGPLRDPFPV